MRAPSFVLLASVAAPALADTHTLFAGFLSSGDKIVRLEFDDVKNELTLTKNITAPGTTAQPWISFDSRRQNLYVLAYTGIQSYSITDDLDLSYQSNVTYPAACTNALSGHMVVSNASPYTVWGVPWGTNCSGLAISVDSDGALQSIVGEAPYFANSTGHGLDLSADNGFVYTADLGGNGVWSHSFDAETNTVTELQYIGAPSGARPRHVAIHPNGKWAYVLYQDTNLVTVMSRDTETGLLTDTNTTYSVLPEGFTNTTSYFADEVIFSSRNTTTPKYLYASTRCHETDSPGYVLAWNLDPDTGAIASTAFLLPTTGSGGSGNAVVPAPWNENYFSITDTADNFTEIWKVADDGSSASAVGHVDLDNGPANAEWYN